VSDEPRDRELVVVAADAADERVVTDLVPALEQRFRVVTLAPDADVAGDVLRLRATRRAGVGVAAGAGAMLRAGLEGPAPDTLVLLRPAAFEPLLADDRLASWEAPVLILGGEEDRATPPDVLERLHERMPSSSLGLLPGCRDPLTEAWETVGPMVLEYLRARYLRAPHGHGDPSGVVMLQLERRPAWVDLAEYEEDDPEPVVPDPADQEVGPGA
jgi:pimeloyl-ACP methyl ester carboxylesterase